MLGVVFLGSGEPPNQSEYQLAHEGGQFHLMKLANGQETNLGNSSGLQPGTWATVSIQVNAGQIGIAVNNQQVISATDQNPLQQGGLAFHGMGASIDNVSLTSSAAVTGVVVPMQTISLPTGGGGGGVPTTGGAASWSKIPQNIKPDVTGVFLRIEGLKGACTIDSFKDWLYCTDWEFAVNSKSAQAPTGVLTVTRRISQASPAIWQACVAGNQVQDVALISVTNGRVDMELQLQGVVFQHAGRIMHEPDGAASSANTEIVTMQGIRARWFVPTYDMAGKPKSGHAGGWDFQANTAWQ